MACLVGVKGETRENETARDARYGGHEGLV